MSNPKLRRANYTRWVLDANGRRVHLTINGEQRSHKDTVTKQRNGAKRPTGRYKERVEQRRAEAAQRQAERDARTDAEQASRLAAAGHKCAEYWRLAEVEAA